MSKKIKCALITSMLAVVVAVSAAMSACTIKTNHPRAKITISFNEKTYELEYKMYRNMYPQTVQHFIELADADFYDNMIIHNYNSVDWFTGAYGYDDGEEGYEYANKNNAFGDYLQANDKEQQYYDLASDTSKITPSVFKQTGFDKNGKEIVSDADALPTLIGEFSSNDHNIEKGALTAKSGALKMYYYSKGDTKQKAVVKNSFGQILSHDYEYNCATSVFMMQVASGTSYTATNYCVFAELYNDDAKDVLDELTDAISTYISDTLGSTTKFTSSITTTVDNLDTFANEGGRGIETTFSVPVKPIIIKSVEITKY